MKKSKEPSSESTGLRRRAEDKLDGTETGTTAPRTQEDNARLLHELQVHQVELEIQNEELRNSREAVEAALEQYTDLYDFAPVGYLTLDAEGIIRKSNLTGASLLGVQRSNLINRRLEVFVSEETRPAFNAFLREMFHDAPKAACEVAIPKEGQAPWYVRVDGAAMEPDTGKERLCRIAVTDITEHKRIEDIQSFLVNCGNERSDEDFFRSLARHLAQSLEMDYVCIDRLEGDAQAAQTVAVYFDGKFEDNVAYTLKDTPCGDVVGKAICCFPKDVRHLFPRDAALQEMMAESYAGTTLWGSDGQPLGLIAVIGRKPLVHPKLAESVLRLVSLRAAHELERRVIEEALAKEQANLQAVFDMVNVGMLVIDEAGVVQRVNSTLARWLSGAVPARGRGQPGDFIGCIHALADPEGCGQASHCASCHIRQTFESAFRSGQPVHGVEAEASLSVGGQKVSLWLEISADPLVLDDKRHVILAMNNITARKEKEAELIRLNLILEAHSHSDRAMMRATEESAYLQEVCRIIVEDCGHAMVWIGFAENDEGKSVRPVASAGFEEGYLDTLNITWADAERGRGPTGTAIRTGQPSMCANMLTDPKFAPWREEAVRRGYASSLVLPLATDGNPFGAISVYSREPNAFSDEEMRFLSELADDLAFGIVTLRIRDAHAQATALLAMNEERYRTLFNGMTEGFALHEIITDEDGAPRDYRFLEINPAFERLTGLKASEVVGRTHNEVLPDDSSHWVPVYGKVALTGEPIHFEDYWSALERWYEVFSYRPAPRQFAVVFMDVTGRKQAEADVRRHVEELKARNDELARFNRVAVDRELRMVELKKRINELCIQAGQPPPYPLDFDKEG